MKTDLREKGLLLLPISCALISMLFLENRIEIVMIALTFQTILLFIFLKFSSLFSFLSNLYVGFLTKIGKINLFLTYAVLYFLFIVPISYFFRKFGKRTPYSRNVWPVPPSSTTWKSSSSSDLSDMF